MKKQDEQGLTYTAIPPTTDTNYWQVKKLDNKTKSFTPIDPELHRTLLIEAKKRRRPFYCHLLKSATKRSGSNTDKPNGHPIR